MMPLPSIVFPVAAVALLLGVLLAYLLLRRQATAEYQRGRLEREPELAELRAELDSQRQLVSAEYQRGRQEREPELAELRAEVESLRRLAVAEHARGRLERESEIADLRTLAAGYRGDIEALEARVAALDGELRQQRTRADSLAEERAAALGRLDQLAPLRNEYEQQRTALLAAQTENGRLAARLADMLARSEEQQRAADEKLALLTQAEQRLRESFQALTQQVLDERAQRFGEISQKEIGSLVEPLKEQLREFRETIANTHAAEQRERGVLSAEIQSLKQLNQRISEDAVNLTRALRGDTQAQGAWGELVLERLLQASGLQAGREYETQASFRDEDGGRSRPDVIVRLPDEKDLVIDAKVSLVAYERYVAAEDAASGDIAIREHLVSLKRHIDELGRRQYSDLPGLRTLDFVLMFVPVEAAFVEAVRRDEGIYLYALERNVALVSPSTLLATLRTVAHLWKIERRNINATDIAVRAGRLHDYMAAFISELEAIGQQLGKAQDMQGRALRRLTEGGKGSVILQLQALADLGAKASKRLPGELLQRACGDEEAPSA